MARIYTDKKSEKNTGLIHCANAESVVEKTLASALADAFSQHIPAWRPSATPYFSKKSLSTAQAQGYLRSKMSDGVSQSHASSLVKGFESTAPAWLAQAQPCVSLPFFYPRLSCPSVVQNCLFFACLWS
jgi:hypothetical protein